MNARLGLIPFFDTDFYREANPDVGLAQVDPYLHFLSHGLAEGRAPHPLIDLSFIESQMASNGEANVLDPPRLADALRGNELHPHPLFDPGYYLDRYPDVRQSGTSALQHFIEHGAAEGRSPNHAFDSDEYLRTHPSVSGGPYRAFLDFASIASVARQTSAVAPGQRIQGAMDAVDGRMASGWAWDPDDPERRLVVEVIEGDRVVARGPANRLREDLRANGIGDGQCHFQLKISASLLDGKPHALKARAAGTLLHGTHELVSRPRNDPAFDAIPATETLAYARRMTSDWEDQELAEGYVRDVMDCNLLLETAQSSEAVLTLQHMDECYPPIGLNDVLMGEAQLQVGDLQAAMTAYERVDTNGPLACWALLGMGNTHRLLGHWDKAETLYFQALSVAPDMPQAHARLQQAQFRKSRLEASALEEREEFQAAVNLLAPELVARPEDNGIGDLVGSMLERAAHAQRAVSVRTDPVFAAAMQSWQLLEVVIASVESRIGKRR